MKAEIYSGVLFEEIKNDANGNPRYRVRFTEFVTRRELETTTLKQSLELAAKRAKACGFRVGSGIYYTITTYCPCVVSYDIVAGRPVCLTEDVEQLHDLMVAEIMKHVKSHGGRVDLCGETYNTQTGAVGDAGNVIYTELRGGEVFYMIDGKEAIEDISVLSVNELYAITKILGI